MHARVLAAATIAMSKLDLVPIDPIAVKQVVGGLIFSLTAKNDFAELDVCFHDAGNVEQDLEQVFYDIQNKDITHIIDAISHVGDILVGIQKDTTDCTSIQDDIQRITVWGDIFRHPKMAIFMIGGNIFANMFDIVHHLDALNTAVTATEYQTVGQELGSIMIDALGPVPGVVYPEGFLPESIEVMQITKW